MLMMIIISVIGLGLAVWYHNAESVIEQILIAFIFFTGVVPLTAKWLFQWVSMSFKFNNQNKQNQNKTQSFNPNQKPNGMNVNYANTNTQQFKSNNKSIVANSKKSTKVNPSQYYPRLKEQIIILSKTKQFNRKDILLFKSELDYCLKNHKFIYDKFRFENDMHEIYSKIKSSYLEDKDYLYLLDVLEEMTGKRQTGIENKVTPKTNTKNIISDDIPW